MLHAQVWTVLHVSWSWHKTASTPCEIISNRVCRFWLGIGEGINLIISKRVIRLESRLLRLCNWSVLQWLCYIVTVYRKESRIVSRWSSLAAWASSLPHSWHKLTFICDGPLNTQSINNFSDLSASCLATEWSSLANFLRNAEVFICLVSVSL